MNTCIKKAIIIFFIFSSSCASKTETENKTINQTMSQPRTETQEPYIKKPLIQLKSIKGNFTNSKYDEYIVFYNDPNTEAYKVIYNNQTLSYDKVNLININKVVVIQKRRLEIVKEYDLNTWSMEYDERYLKKIIRNNKLSFGEWNGYSYITDFNGNGLDEILFFLASGIGLDFQIFEYNKVKDRFEDKLIHEGSGTMLTSIETITKNQKKDLKACFYDQRGFTECFIYEWNKDKEVYDIIERTKEKSIVYPEMN